MGQNMSSIFVTYVISFSDADGGLAGWATECLEVQLTLKLACWGLILVNPIPTRGTDDAHHITACPPIFEILMEFFHCSFYM